MKVTYDQWVKERREYVRRASQAQCQHCKARGHVRYRGNLIDKPHYSCEVCGFDWSDLED